MGYNILPSSLSSPDEIILGTLWLDLFFNFPAVASELIDVITSSGAKLNACLVSGHTKMARSSSDMVLSCIFLISLGKLYLMLYCVLEI